LSATPARSAALAALRAVRAGELADRALAPLLEGLPPDVRPWTLELVYGTLRLRGRLDHRLAAHVRRPLRSLEPDMLDVLRLGAYQLGEMASVPAYAAVSQSVELAKRVSGAGAARLVNAVLNALSRGGEPAYPPFEADAAGYLSSWGSHPAWLVERWIERWGAATTRALVEADNTRPDVFVRAVGVSGEEAAAGLAAAGIAAEPVAAVDGSLRLASSADTLRALEAAPVVVQDPAASLVARYAAPGQVAHFVDLAAAPGGKTLAIAGAEDAPALTVAADVAAERLALLISNVRRVAARAGRTPRIAPIVADARMPPFRSGGIDAVMLDAPCTGTGTLRRHADARWRIGPRDLVALGSLQAELIEAAAELVRSGGILIYATCSLEREENEAQVESFLDAHRDFRVEPGPAEPDLLDAHGRLLVMPHQLGFDGAFAARMRRG